MADEPAQNPNANSIMNNTWKGVIVGVVLLLCIWTIAGLVLYGKPGNSLHTDALSWSYTMIAGILGALGLGTLSALIPLTIGKKS